jgi:hypothetical protein
MDYNTDMHIVRMLVGILTSALLKFSLFNLALVIALLYTLGNADALKQSLSQSGIYDQVVDSFISAAKNNSPQPSTQLPLDNPEITKIAKDSFTPEVFKTTGESIIDGLYGWLEGQTPRPQFEVDLTAQRDRFTHEIAEYAENRLETLPSCSLQENIQLSQQDSINPFTVSCRPPLSIATEKQRLIAQLQSQEGLLGNPVITPDDFTGNSAKEPDFANSPAPEIFRWLKRAPVILVGISLLAAAATVLLAGEKRQGWRSVGMTLLGTGLFLLIGTLIFTYLFNTANRPEGSLGQSMNLTDRDVRAAVLDIIRTLFTTLSMSVVKVSSIYVAVGAGILFVIRSNRPTPTNGLSLAAQGENGTLPGKQVSSNKQ